MATEITSLTQLTATDVQHGQLQLTELLRGAYPELALERGVLHDLVLFLHGISHAVTLTEISRVQTARSLLEITQHPDLADTTTVDHILSNYLITRKVGTRADGVITIVVEGDSTMVLAANSRFIASGLTFRTDVPITARPPGTVVTAVNDRTLIRRDDGRYEFTVPVTAEEVGEQYNLRVGAKFEPEPPPARFVTAYSAADFTGGRADETNTEVLSRMANGIAAKVAAGRTNIAAMIRERAAFADTLNISIVGYGDPEMVRDQHGIIPVSGGGRIDVYCQSLALPLTKTLRIAARLVSIRSTDSIWQFTLDRDAAPGFYDVQNIRRLSDPSDVAGFELVSDLRSWDFADDTWHPDIITTAEALYTRYQTTVIQFIDTATPRVGLTVGDTVEYAVDVLTQENIGNIQDFLNSSTSRHLAADLLVKSAIPCFLTVDVVIERDSQESAPDLAPIRTAIAAMVNKAGFAGTIYGTQITGVINGFLQGTQAVSSILLRGKIRKPDGSFVSLRDAMTITIPELPSIGITPRTTCFALYPDSIGLTVNIRRT